MALLKVHKVISALPAQLEADSIYMVRVGAGFDMYVTDATGAIAYISNNGGAITGAGTASYVPKFTGAGTIGNGIIYDTGIAVGIGTTTPFRALDVNGALRLYQGTIDFGNSTNNQIWVSSNNINFKTNGSEKAIITGAGNFGIGTSSPTTKLDVRGYISSIGNSGFNGYQLGDYGSDAGTFSISALSGRNLVFKDEFAGSERMRMDAYGRIGIGTSSPSSILHLSGTATVLTITDTSYGRTSQIGYLDYANLYIANDPSSNTYIGAYNSVFLAYGGGNVGIGTTSPGYKLDVNGALRSSQYSFITNTYDGRGIYADDGGGSTIFSLTRQASNEVRLQGYSSLTFFTDGSTGSEKMRITYDGKVGIGTSNPIWKFVVSKNGAAGLEIDPDNGTAGKIGVYAYNRSASAYVPISFEASSYFLNGGSVAIGTSTIDSSAILQLDSTTQGFLPPRMNQTEIQAISNPAAGLLVFDSDGGRWMGFDGVSWRAIVLI